MQAKSKYRFPWRDGNRFSLLVDGECFFTDMLEALALARQQILMEMYLVESGHVFDRFVGALVEARARGVQVCVLLDDFGSRGLRRHDLQRLRDADIHTALYNPVRLARLRRSMFRDHRKMLIIDRELAFVGGTGIADAFWPKHPREAWHEAMVRIEGPVVGDWWTLFRSAWRAWSKECLLELPPPASLPDPAQTGRVVYNQSPMHLEVKRSVVKRVQSAERRVWLATAYFVPSLRLRRALRRAAGSGTDVRLLLPGRHTDHPSVRHAGRRYYSHLLRAGVRIFEYQPRFMHAKLLLADNWVSMGSSNVDRFGQRWNLDANQEVDDQAFATAVAELMQADFAKSAEIPPGLWEQRPRWRRLLEWFFGLIERWVHRQ